MGHSWLFMPSSASSCCLSLQKGRPEGRCFECCCHQCHPSMNVASTTAKSHGGFAPCCPQDNVRVLPHSTSITCLTAGPLPNRPTAQLIPLREAMGLGDRSLVDPRLLVDCNGDTSFAMARRRQHFDLLPLLNPFTPLTRSV